jgi:hypothetical protein
MVWLVVAGLILIASLLWTMRDRVKAYKMAAERAKEGDQFAAKMREFHDALEVAYKDIESVNAVLLIVRSSWRLEEPCLDVSGIIAGIEHDGLRAAVGSAVELLKTNVGPSS